MPVSTPTLRQTAAAISLHDQQLAALNSWLGRLTPDEFTHTTPTGTIRHVVGFLLMVHNDLSAALDEPASARALDTDAVLSIWHNRHSHRRANELCGCDSGADLSTQLHTASVDFASRASAAPDTVRLAAGSVRTLDLLRVVVTIWTRIARDMNNAVPRLVNCEIPAAALATSVRTLAGILAARHLGHSIEVRVPPHIAVQCGTGPSHTRGTPPNVVECEPWTFLDLATGRLTWPDAVAQHLVAASGHLADLSAMLPLYQPLSTAE